MLFLYVDGLQKVVINVDNYMLWKTFFTMSKNRFDFDLNIYVLLNLIYKLLFCYLTLYYYLSAESKSLYLSIKFGFFLEKNGYNIW